MRHLWTEINGKPERCDLARLLLTIKELGEIIRWRPGGFETAKCPAGDYIRFYWGDDNGNLTSDILFDERALIEGVLK